MRLPVRLVGTFVAQPLVRQIVAFGLVGTVGFVVNAGVLWSLQDGLGPIRGQVVGFAVAVTATWWLNRRYTFASRKPWLGEWVRYAGANLVGWSVTNGAYLVLVLNGAFFHANPVAALAIGSVLGMAFNFVAARTVMSRSS